MGHLNCYVVPGDDASLKCFFNRYQHANAYMAHENEGMDTLGIRLGYVF